MHWQSRNPSHERDHNIALMPAFDPEHPKRGTIRRALFAFVLFGFGWFVFTSLVAALSTPRL